MKSLFAFLLGIVVALPFGWYISQTTVSYQGPRKAQYPVESLIINRWSPRAMTGQLIGQQGLMSLFEAARWAPSSYNDQPWIFGYVTKDSLLWSTYFNLLVDFNKSWAHNAGVLIIVASRKNYTDSGEPYPSHSFDTGAAGENLALQGSAMGLVVHMIEGFDKDRAYKELNIDPAQYTIETMIAVGQRAGKETLTKALQEREVPSDRKPIEKFVFHGRFPKEA
jgi:nitroreductase